MTPVHDLVILKRLKILLKPSKSPYILQVSWCLHTGFCIKVNGRCCQLMPRFVRWGRYVQNLSWFIKGCFTILLSTIISSEAELLAVMHAIDKIWPDIHYGLNVSFSVVSLLHSISLDVPWRFRLDNPIAYRIFLDSI